ncbi:unnamed protein product [Thelazia callipaeda]|uniref:Abhydrolase_3 domain-containing protein n=1 Tax=Thelazia callipaeda TaxID=103827 RepID=A0A0N5CS89_THECL|nr:unnamed protein product [Thelazia callipaeda]
MQCKHGIRCTEQECLFSPSHWSSSFKSPQMVIQSFITCMQCCYQNNLRSIHLQQAIPYGDGNQKIDIWGDENESNAGIVLLHGGYWKEGSRKLFTSPVNLLTNEGFVVACVGYDFATVIPLREIIIQVRKAFILILFQKFLAGRWSSKKLLIAGHSAGAHLAIAALLSMENTSLYEKIVLFSGIYDLYPLVGTYIGNDINLNWREAEIASTVNLDGLSAKLLAIVAAEESPKFIEQSMRIVQNYLRKRPALQLYDCCKIISNVDHFSLITSLSDSDSESSKALLHFIQQKHLF